MSNNWLTWAVYILMRLAVFLIPFSILVAVGLPYWLAAVFAAIIGLSLSVLFLSKQRNAASETIYRRRERKGKTKQRHSAIDAAEEDALVDAAPDPEPKRDSEGEAHAQ